MKKFLNNQSGQSLITLLFFMVIGITVISAATLVLAAGILSAGNAEKGMNAYYLAESGAEDGILYLIRKPTYSGTLPSLSVGSGQVSVSINSGTITSTGTYGTTVKKIQVNTAFVSGAFNISSWKEIN